MQEKQADGVYFIDLAPIREPSLVITTIARTLGVQERGGQSLLVNLKAFLYGSLQLDESVFQAVTHVLDEWRSFGAGPG